MTSSNNSPNQFNIDDTEIIILLICIASIIGICIIFKILTSGIAWIGAIILGIFSAGVINILRKDEFFNK